MPLPPRPDPDQLRRRAKERLRAARSGDDEAVAWILEVDAGLTLSATQLRLAREHGFDSWSHMLIEIARRRMLDVRDPQELAALIADRPELATAEMQNWSDHPLGASPLGYVAMARFDTHDGVWRDVTDTGVAAQVLIAAGAPIDGGPADRETPLITAASYGDADVAAVLVAAGADLEATARDDAGGVPGGTALLHAAVFGSTEVIDVLVTAGARPASFEEAAAVGDIGAWQLGDVDEQTRLRGLIMAADHQRLDVIDELVAVGTPFDAADQAFGRHALRLAAANGRPSSVRCLLKHGADPAAKGPDGVDALEACRHGRRHAPDVTEYDEVERLLTQRGSSAGADDTSRR